MHNDWFTIWASGAAIILPILFKSLEDAWSIPLLFFGARSEMIFTTSFASTHSNAKEEIMFCLRYVLIVFLVLQCILSDNLLSILFPWGGILVNFVLEIRWCPRIANAGWHLIYTKYTSWRLCSQPRTCDTTKAYLDYFWVICFNFPSVVKQPWYWFRSAAIVISFLGFELNWLIDSTRTVGRETPAIFTPIKSIQKIRSYFEIDGRRISVCHLKRTFAC